jgi:hypothetical protein
MSSKSLDKALEDLGIVEAMRAKILVEVQKRREESVEYIRRDLDDLKEKLKYEEQIEGSMRSQLEIHELKNQKMALEAKEVIKIYEQELATGKLRDADGVAYEELIQKEREFLQLVSQRNDKLREWRDTFKSITGISNDWENGFLAKMAQDPEAFNQAFETTFNSMNILHSTSAKIIEGTLAMVAAQDEAMVQFAKNTGQSQQYGDQLLQLESEMHQFGVGLEEASSAMTGLITNQYKLEGISKNTQHAMTTTTALLDKMGVAADTTTKNMNFLTTAMGMSGDQAAATQADMYLTAQSLSRPASEMADAFEANSKVMAKFGKDSTDVFKKLYVNATKAGMAVDQLLSITEKFDTFEGAATSVGRLNALLGGPFLNSMDMVMNTDPTERMKMLSDAVNSAGVAFDDMGYYQKKTLTEAMGLADVSELALVMAGDFDTMAASSTKSQAELIALKNQTKEFNTVMDEMKQIGRMLVMDFFYPAVQMIKTLAGWIQTFGGIIKMIIPVIAALSIALKFNAINWKQLSLRIQEVKMAAGGPLIGIIMTAMAVFEYGGPVLKLFAFAVAAVATAWALLNVASAGIIPLITGILTLIMMLTQYFFQDDVGASTFLEGLVKLGHAFMGIGAGMITAAAGVWILLPAMFALLALTVPLLLATLPGGAFWSLSTGLGWIAASLDKMDTSKLSALTVLFTALSAVTADAASNILLMGVGIAAMGGGFALMAINPVAVALAPLAIGAVAAGGTMANRGAPGPKDTGKREKLLPLTVKLEMNGKKMGEFVREVVVKELNYNKG